MYKSDYRGVRNIEKSSILIIPFLRYNKDIFDYHFYHKTKVQFEIGPFCFVTYDLWVRNILHHMLCCSPYLVGVEQF